MLGAIVAGWMFIMCRIVRVHAWCGVHGTGRGSTSKSPTCFDILGTVMRFTNALRYKCSSRRANEGKKEWRGKKYDAIHIDSFLGRIGLAYFLFCCFCLFLYSHAVFFFYIFYISVIYSCISLRSVYAGAQRIFGYKSPAGFILNIILTSNLLHSQHQQRFSLDIEPKIKQIYRFDWRE